MRARYGVSDGGRARRSRGRDRRDRGQSGSADEGTYEVRVSFTEDTESYTPIVTMGSSRSRLTVTTTGQGSVEVYNDISHSGP